MPDTRLPRLPLVALFLVSGAAGLLHEVAWTRLFTTIFGATALAVSAVLAAFMGGLALGAHIFGGRADSRGDELRLYGWLEIGVGAAALLVLPALSLAGDAFAAIHRTWHPPFATMSLVRFAFSFVLLLVPTALMGGTLPILVRYWTRHHGSAGRSLGHLYAINTFGAMVGCFVAGFFLIEWLGVRGTVFLAVAVNFAVGAVALALARRERGPAPAAPAPSVAPIPDDAPIPAGPDATDRGRARLALIAIGASGFLALAYEVAWTRVLVYVLTAAIHAFTVMLTVFLGGLALGSLVLAGRVRDPRTGFRVFGALEIGIGLAALGSILMLNRLPGWHEQLLVGLNVQSWSRMSILKLVEAGVVVLVPTFLMGATFPVVCELLVRDAHRVGRSVGSLVAVNTVGAVLGSFACGFLLIPWLGTQTTIVVLAGANAALGGALWLAAEPDRLRGPRVVAALVPAAAVLALSTLLPDRAFLPVFGINLPGGRISYYREGATGTVTIHDAPSGTRLLSVNGSDVAGTSFQLRTTQKLQAHLPLLLHPEPRQVLQVGLGSGETAHSILLHPEVERLTGCDISPEVIEAGVHFQAINEQVYRNPRLDIVFEDAKNFAAYTDREFDLILNDSVHPIFRGSSDLYALDYFLACRERLRLGGMMSSWFPLVLLSDEDLRVLLRTFREAFPTSTVWVATNSVTRNALLLGWKDDGPLRIDFSDFTRRFHGNEALRQDLAEIHLYTPYSLLDAFQLDPEALEELTSGAKLNTYDRPHLEFSAPRVLVGGDRVLWARNFDAVAAHRKPIEPYLVSLAPDADNEARIRRRLEQRAAASEHVMRGLSAELHERESVAREAYEAAQEILPRDPLATTLLARLDLDRAVLEDRIDAGSESPEDWYRMARQHRQVGALDREIECLRRAIELRPGYVRARLELAIALRESGALDEAREAANAALEHDPRLSAGWAVLGSIEAAAGNLAAAEADLRRASDEGAGLPWAELLLARILRERGAEAEARTHLEAAIDLAPDSPAGAEARALLEAEPANGGPAASR